MSFDLSIIIPAYNCDNTLRKSIESLDRIRSQWLFEIIIIDDCSDFPVQIPKSNLNIRIYRNEQNQGPAFGRNKGASLARGKYLLFLDADIALNDDAIEKLRKYYAVENCDSIVGFYNKKSYYENFSSIYFHLRSVFLHEQLGDDTHICHGAIFSISKKAFEEIGGFNSDFKKASVEDLEFGLRALRVNKKLKLKLNFSGDHLKELTVKGLLKNDFERSADRVQFLFNKLIFRNLSKGEGFDHTGNREILSVLFCALTILSLFLLPILWSVTFLSIIYFLNLSFLKYILNNSKIRTYFLSVFFLPIDYFVIGLGVAFGLAVTISKKLFFRWRVNEAG